MLKSGFSVLPCGIEAQFRQFSCGSAGAPACGALGFTLLNKKIAGGMVTVYYENGSLESLNDENYSKYGGVGYSVPTFPGEKWNFLDKWGSGGANACVKGN